MGILAGEHFARQFVKQMGQFGMKNIAQVSEPQFLKRSDRSPVLRKREGHNPLEVQLAKAIPQDRSRGFSRLFLSPVLEAKPIVQLDLGTLVQIEGFQAAGAEEFLLPEIFPACAH